ncbi:hypothetical protein Tco_0380964 [Tanacetum coccineum]
MIIEIRSFDGWLALQNQGASIKTLEIQIRKISKALQERGFRSVPSSTEANPRDHVKSISTTEADTNLIRRIGSPQYAISTPHNRRLMFESRQTTIPFPCRLNDYYCEEMKGSYGPQFLEAYSYEASHIDNSIPQKEKDPGSFTLPCYINNVCFDNALADLGAGVSVMPLLTYLNLGLGELAHLSCLLNSQLDCEFTKGIAVNVLVGVLKVLIRVPSFGVFVRVEPVGGDDIRMFVGLVWGQRLVFTCGSVMGYGLRMEIGGGRRHREATKRKK